MKRTTYGLPYLSVKMLLGIVSDGTQTAEIDFVVLVKNRIVGYSTYNFGHHTCAAVAIID